MEYTSAAPLTWALPNSMLSVGLQSVGHIPEKATKPHNCPCRSVSETETETETKTQLTMTMPMPMTTTTTGD